MKSIIIKTIEELRNANLENFEIIEDITIDIQLKLIDQEIEYPIHIIHKVPEKHSELRIKMALYGRSKVKMPVEILVEKGAVDTATRFKALVLQMSPNAQANITPGLLIHEKNIQAASHGVVIKNIKDKDLEYLQARGIEKETAREIIVGF